MTIRIGDLTVGPGHPCALVAEIGNAHNGSYEQAIALLNACKDAGVSAAKLQCYTPDELVALRGDGPAPAPWGDQGWTMRTLYETAMTPREWFPSLFAHARLIGLPLFSSVFGAESLQLLESCHCPAYKIARLDNQHEALYRDIGLTGRPLIVSRTWNDDAALVPMDLTLYCPPGYPQSDADLRLQHHWFQREYDGFSYHGRDLTPCVVAATLGATMLEFHVQLDDARSQLEPDVSLTMTQVAELVQRVRDVERYRA